MWLDEVSTGWAWRAAGVRNLVLPRWSTDEPASEAFMKAVHDRLRAGDAADVAAHAARATVRSTRATAAPFYWAGWMVVSFR